MSIQDMIAEAQDKSNESVNYLGDGKHTVRVQAAAIKTGEDARPTWATKSLHLQLGNDEGVRFAEFEMEPLTFSDGSENVVGQKVLIGALTGMGVNLDGAATMQDVVQRGTAFITGGNLQGAELDINIKDKPSNKTNPNTGKPYMYRNTYINGVVTPGIGAADVAEAFDAEEVGVF